MSGYNTPVAKLGRRVLIAKESDLSKIGTNKAMEVLVEQWDLETGLLEGRYELEKLLKFNPWEDIIETNEIDEIKAKIREVKNSENREFKIR